MVMAVETRPWTIEDLDRLPDDENTYEVVRGELFVTPPPTDDHQTISARLNSILVPYVTAQGLGYVYHPRGVVQIDGSQVEPDLIVRHPAPPKTPWKSVPLPILIVEVRSPSTWSRDQGPKRSLYMDARIPEYWMVDGETRTIRVSRPNGADVLVQAVLTWNPAGATHPLDIELDEVFGK